MARKEITPEQWRLARVQWQAEPLLSYANIGASLGVSKQAVGKRAKVEGWQKRIGLAELTERAYEAADLMEGGSGGENARVVESRAPQVDGLPKYAGPLSEFELQRAADRAALEQRVAILARHRSEINGPRKLIYESIKGTGDIEKARLAKTAAEAMKLVQDAERKAWGFDRDGDRPAPVVIIERGGRRSE